MKNSKYFCPKQFTDLLRVETLELNTIVQLNAKEKMMKNIQRNAFFSLVLATVALLIGCSENQNQQSDVQVASTECTLCPKMKAGQDTLEFVNQIRRFVAKNADTGLIQNEMCDTFANIPVEQFNVDEFLTLFQNDKGTASCGLAGMMMVKILLENGIDAYTYNFGFKDTELSHIIVLVKQNQKLLIFDPFMNYEMLDKDGNNMDILTLIESVGENRTDVYFSTDTVIADMVVDFRLLNEAHFSLLNKPGCNDMYEARTEVRDSVYKMNRYRCFACASDARCTSFVKRFEDKLTTVTKLTTIQEGIALKINEVYGAPDYLEVDDMISTWIYSQPKLGDRLGGKLIH